MIGLASLARGGRIITGTPESVITTVMQSQLWSKLSSRERRAPGIAFPVDDVTLVATPIWTEALGDILGRRLGRKILVLPDRHQPVTNALYDSATPELRARFDALPALRRPVSACHPLIHAVHVAFSQHRPLTLSPDAIWLVIAQGFSHHVTANAEKLRHRLVRHEGRRALGGTITGWTPAEFEPGIADLSSQIREATDPVLHETLVCDFSTTTPAIRTASEVAIMDTFSAYFDYEMMCVCGIPKIAIEGSLDDWRRIRARVEVLDTYRLEWWVARLRPILDEFVLAAEGHPTREFWQAIYKPEKAYGDDVATGWIADLFPYLGDAPGRYRNHVFEHQRLEWALPIDKGVQTGGRRSFYPLSDKGVKLGGFPSGLSSVPVKVRFFDGSEHPVEVVAGFFAVKQHPAEGALSPLIGWSVAAPHSRCDGANRRHSETGSKPTRISAGRLGTGISRSSVTEEMPPLPYNFQPPISTV